MLAARDRNEVSHSAVSSNCVCRCLYVDSHTEGRYMGFGLVMKKKCACARPWATPLALTETRGSGSHLQRAQICRSK